MSVYEITSEFCAEVAASWRKTQRANLALAMRALLQRRTLTLSHLAQELPSPSLLRYRRNRPWLQQTG